MSAITELLKNVSLQKPTSSSVAGQNESTGDMIDMSGFDSVLLIASLGAVTDNSVITLTAKQGATTVSTGAAILAGTTATVSETSLAVANNNMLAMDIVKPTDRYIWPIITITTANCVIDGVYAIKYGSMKGPTADTSDVVHGVTNITPAEA